MLATNQEEFAMQQDKIPPAAVPMGVYVDPKAMDWEPTGLPGAFRKVLYDDPETGRSTVLFRMEPGGVIPFHEHPELEQTFVLDGSLEDDQGACTAGTFVWRPAGSRHTARCPNGATFLVFFMKPPKRLPQA
jgi:anti-sigma factor ChrR (cupin superfamily)